MNKLEQGVPLGHHIIVDLFGCRCEEKMLSKLYEGKKVMKQLAKIIHPLGMATYQFKPASYSIVLLLEESHFSMHSWVQHKFISCDFYTCTGTFPAEAVDIVEEVFKPTKIVRIDIERGKLLPKTTLNVSELMSL